MADKVKFTTSAGAPIPDNQICRPQDRAVGC